MNTHQPSGWLIVDVVIRALGDGRGDDGIPVITRLMTEERCMSHGNGSVCEESMPLLYWEESWALALMQRRQQSGSESDESESEGEE